MNQAAAPYIAGVVRAVSTALPREELVYDKPTMTSIVRSPREGPVFFGEDGPENNRTAVHIDHVLAFASEHYDYWTRELGIARADWPWSFWGENLTIDGLDEARLCIGDIIRCGEAELEVNGPRTPCYKLSWRVGQSVDFLKRVVQSGRVGVYLKVVRPGHIRAGDTATVHPAGKTEVTVAQTARMIGDLRIDDLAVARSLVRLRELGDSSRQSLVYKINFLDDVVRCRAHRWQGWRPFRIASLAREGRDAIAVTLEAADGMPIAPYRAGQHLTVKIPGAPPIVRSWSISEFEPHPDRYRITVKRHSGPGSQWMNDAAQVGDIVELRAPAGRFVLDRSSFHRVVLVSAGIGMTPMLSMLRAHLLRGDEAPALHWLHSTTDAGAMYHAAEVDALLRASKLATRQVHFTAAVEGNGGAACDRRGRIAAADLAAILATDFPSADGMISEPGEYSHFYVCGPEAFNRMVIDALLALGVPRDEIFTEAFSGTPGDRSKPLRLAPATVEFARSGITVSWEPREDATLLELAEQAGIDAPFSCRAGNCGSCEVGLLAGQVDYDPVPDAPVGQKRCLTCCARPSSDRVTLDI